MSSGDFRFGRTRRLRTKAEFSRVFREGQRYSCADFSLFIAVSNHRYPRLGLAVSRRVSKRAVVRNLIKRRLREIFRTRIAPSLAGRATVDLVVVVRPGLDASYRNLSSRWLKLIDKWLARSGLVPPRGASSARPKGGDVAST